MKKAQVGMKVKAYTGRCVGILIQSTTWEGEIIKVNEKSIRVRLTCLAKGTLLRSDYEARGYSDNMWLADTALAAQLGLITKQPDGEYTINRELQTEFSKLKPHQKKAITAIYEAFGYDTFSSEMFVATLNYSVSYTYASLHKLTLLRILEQKITDEGCQYQLLVNPEDHPECFIEAA